MVQGVPGGLWLRVSRLMAYVFVIGFCAALSLQLTAQLASTFADCWPVAALYRGHEMSRIELVLAGQAAPHFRSAGETIVPSGDEPPAAEVWQRAAGLDQAEGLDIPAAPAGWGIAEAPPDMPAAAPPQASKHKKTQRVADRQSASRRQIANVDARKTLASPKPSRRASAAGLNIAVRAKRPAKAVAGSKVVFARAFVTKAAPRGAPARIAALATPGEIVRMQIAGIRF